MAKKLMARVRPGVEETLACLESSSALSRLDLPTLERPRKATSGMDGAGNCAGEWAESRNLEKTRIRGILTDPAFKLDAIVRVDEEEGVGFVEQWERFSMGAACAAAAGRV